MFWAHADEERSHAIEFIKYLRMRGAENNDFFGGEPLKPREEVFDWQGVDDVSKHCRLLEELVPWVSLGCYVSKNNNNTFIKPNFPHQALQLALKMEKDVTARMQEMIDICSQDGLEDHHAGDWLAGGWMTEQLEGQRKLAGLINTFNNFK